MLTSDYYYEVEKTANDNNVTIIVDNLDDFSRIDNDNKNGIEILNFNNIEYISNTIHVAYKENIGRDLNLFILDYSKSESVGEFLRYLYFESKWVTGVRKRIRAFEYKNKLDSNIKYIIINNYIILSPFTKELDEEIFKNDIDNCIEQLREKCKFNELVEYVYKNSIYKVSIEENECRKIIEDAYKELIEDYINFVYKENKGEPEKDDLDETSNITNEEVAFTIDEVKEKDADKINI